MTPVSDSSCCAPHGTDSWALRVDFFWFSQILSVCFMRITLLVFRHATSTVISLPTNLVRCLFLWYPTYPTSFLNLSQQLRWTDLPCLRNLFFAATPDEPIVILDNICWWSFIIFSDFLWRILRAGGSLRWLMRIFLMSRLKTGRTIAYTMNKYMRWKQKLLLNMDCTPYFV